MACFKCKSCGGELEFSEKERVVECKFCGALQTVPTFLNERNLNIYNHANELRRNNEYDKASSLYEELLIENPEVSDLYWSIILCKFGVEYVDDVLTNKKIPTINRVQYTSIYDDENYKQAIKYALDDEKAIYMTEAKLINEIQKKYLEISAYEDPYDVFICYKETDERGRRTRDSVLANDLYSELVSQGYKVFFARVTLEDKLGKAYEPYIFQALNTAKVMVVVGSDRAYYDAVWVKNEWSRFINLTKKDNSKVLIPAYAGMDASDLPDEFKEFQAQDMTKLGFLQNLVKRINKLVNVSEEDNNVTLEGIFKRVDMLIEDEEFKRAGLVLDKALNIDSSNPDIYEKLLLVDFNCKKLNDLMKVSHPLDDNFNYQRLLRFGDDEMVSKIKKINEVASKNYRSLKELRRIKKRRKFILIFISIIIGSFVVYEGYNYYTSSVRQPQYVAKLVDENTLTLGNLHTRYDSEAIYNVGKYYQNRQEDDKAIKTYEEILTYEDAMSRRDKLLVNKIEKSTSNREFDEAKYLLKKVVEPSGIDKEQINKTIGLAEGDYNLALQDYDKAIKLYTENGGEKSLDKIANAVSEDSEIYVYILQNGRFDLASKVYNDCKKNKDLFEDVNAVLDKYLDDYKNTFDNHIESESKHLIDFLSKTNSDNKLINDLKLLFIEKYPTSLACSDYKYDLTKNLGHKFNDKLKVKLDNLEAEIFYSNDPDYNKGPYANGYVDEDGRKYLDLNKVVYVHSNIISNRTEAKRINFDVSMVPKENCNWNEKFRVWMLAKDRHFNSNRSLGVSTMEYAIVYNGFKYNSVPPKGSWIVEVRASINIGDSWNEQIINVGRVDFVYDRYKGMSN